MKQQGKLDCTQSNSLDAVSEGEQPESGVPPEGEGSGSDQGGNVPSLIGASEGSYRSWIVHNPTAIAL